MSNKPFIYCAPFPMGKDNTEYYLLTSDYVSVADFDGETILKVEPEAPDPAGAASLSRRFFYAPSGTPETGCGYSSRSRSQRKRQVRGAAILKKLRNRRQRRAADLPDTGTAIIVGKKGQRVWTGGGDEEALSKGVYNTYIEDNLRYSQNAALDMYKEVNTGTNLPAQIDLYAVDGDEYKFLCVAKGGGSANKTYLYQKPKPC